MIGKHIVGGPDFFDLILVDAQEDGAGFVAGGKKNEIADEQRCRGADGGVEARPPREIETQLAVGRVQRHESAPGEKEGVAPVTERGRDG